MGKRQTGVSSTKTFKHPHKTKKRLTMKRAMLDAKGATKRKGKAK